MSIEVLREFLGWCLAINVGLMIFTFVVIIALGDTAAIFHGKMFKLEPDTVRREFYHYMANYKIAIIVFNLVPYLALLAMADGG